MHELSITYLYIICKYYHTIKDRGVLVCPTQNSQCNIPSSKYRIRFPV